MSWPCAALTVLAALLVGGPQTDFSTRTTMVRVHVRLSGTSGLAAGTTPEFLVRDNGVSQRADVIPLRDAPLDLRIAIDVSGSVRIGQRLSALRSALTAVVERLRPTDHVRVMTFAEQPRLLIAGSADDAHVRGAIETIGAAGGSTALYDATLVATLLDGPTGSVPVVILLSDGRDTASWTAERDAVTSARASGAFLFGIGIDDAGRRPGDLVRSWTDAARLPDRRFLDETAAATGGAVQLVASADTRALQTAFARAIEQVRQGYLVTYPIPQPVVRGWHTLAISLKAARGRVHARSGYLE